MKIAQINMVCGSGSTGRICLSISKVLNECNIENRILYAVGNSDDRNSIKYTNRFTIKAAALQSQIAGNWGFEYSLSTGRLIRCLEEFKPDIVHIHNIHGHACNIQALFNWLRKNGVKVVWTFHDCWAFTGYCVHYDMNGCEKWKAGCNTCPQKKKYSLIFDRSRALYQKKKHLADDVDLYITTPSDWLMGQVKQSCLGAFPVIRIYNGVNLDVFRRYSSNVLQKYSVSVSEHRFVIIGVAAEWVPRKGPDVFIELAKRLGKEYRVIMVGKPYGSMDNLPDNISLIPHVDNPVELAQLYSCANVFVNPTLEEVFGLVNIEALACGTPVITYRTGGSTECVDDTCGAVVEKKDIEGLEKEIIRICTASPYSHEACRERARLYDEKIVYQQYVALYKRIMEQK